MITQKIPHACSVKAIRSLLQDPQWAPSPIVDLVLQYRGLPREIAALYLPMVAPVSVWSGATIVDDHIEVYNEVERKLLTKEEISEAAIGYATPHKNIGHMEYVCGWESILSTISQKRIWLIVTR